MQKVRVLVERQQLLVEKLKEAKLDALVLNPGPSLVYFTGVHFHLMERPILGIFTIDKPPVFVIPRLESAKLDKLLYPYKSFQYGESPDSWGSIFKTAFEDGSRNLQNIAIEPNHLRVLELRYLENAVGRKEFASVEGAIASIRMIKDITEVDAMRKAVEVAQKALVETLPMIHTGATERQIANALSLQLIQAGSDTPLPFSPIVAGGPNSANPHAFPTSRSLQEGDLLVIDWGASIEGYFSDITRTFVIGSVQGILSDIAKIVHEANRAARVAVRPGIPAGEIDRSARDVIVSAGYGEYFIHRTGHGLGLEAHEAPYIRQDSNQKLAPGMTFTIEPGIYVPDVGGVRIEDDVHVTQEGIDSLTDLPRELIELPR